MNNVKKVFICIGIIIVIGTACFFTGYSLGSNRLNDSGIRNGTELIREQGIAIKNIEDGIRETIDESSIIIDEVEVIVDEVEKLESGLKVIEEGLREDIDGIQGVIDLLKYYRGQGEVLEESNSN
jgi:hypothetical protein